MAITMALFSRLRLPLQAGLDTSRLLISARASQIKVRALVRSAIKGQANQASQQA